MSNISLRVRTAFASVIGFCVFGVVIFVPAGRLDWVAGWLYLAVLAVNFCINYVFLRRRNPDLIEHRMRFGKGTKTWDKVWAWSFAPVYLSIFIIAGLDAGRYASLASPRWLWSIGLVLFAAGTALLTWAMSVNPFFEKTVRIQTERGHCVIDTGPYRFIRHPGYLGFFGWILSTPLLLDSLWAFVPSCLAVAGLIIRTALEDRTLRDELGGYIEYASRVHFRLIPGVW